MATSIREILTEAFARANVVPRRQAAPGDMVENGYKLLKGIVNRFNNDNYLSFTQNEVDIYEPYEQIHIYNESNICEVKTNIIVYDPSELTQELAEECHAKGIRTAFVNDGHHNNGIYTVFEVGTQSGVIYTWGGARGTMESPYFQEIRKYVGMKDFPLGHDIAKIQSILFKYKNSTDDEWYRLSYVPYSEFNNYTDNDTVYTYIEKGQGEWVVMIKKSLAKDNVVLKLIYNDTLKFDLNSDLYIPDAYIELLIVALTHKLALQYPRLDAAQMSRLESDLAGALQNVKTPKAESKYVMREDNYRMTNTYQGILTGRHLW